MSNPSWSGRLWRHLTKQQSVSQPPPSFSPNAQTEETSLDRTEITPFLTWHVGDSMLDHYLVTGLRGEDGSGIFYQVHHSDRDIDLMVKCPLPEVFASRGGREHFLCEAETWTNLPLHPHIVNCCYVLLQGEIPYIFAEDVAGGSLADWIRDRRLYQGGHQLALARLLDIAIQCAWGLHAAHEQGMVHQAFSPDAVLLTVEGVAKVMNFQPSSSPEQVAALSLSRQNDLWSWAISVLEMFAGAETWQEGAVMHEVVASFEVQDAVIPPMPLALRQVLVRCFEPNPEQRPANLLAIVTELQAISTQELGYPFPRVFPQPVRLLPNVLNNRALSLYHLGKVEAAKHLWDQALRDDPLHLEATYNRGIALWRSGELADDVLLQQLELIRATESAHDQEKQWHASYLLAQVHRERGDREGTLHMLEEVRSQASTQNRRAAERALQEFTLSPQARQDLSSQHVLREDGDHGVIISLSADGKRAVSVGPFPYGGGVRMWDVSSEPRVVNVIDWNNDEKMRSVQSVSLRADGSEALFGGYGSYASDGGDYPILLLVGFRGRRRSFKARSQGDWVTSVSLSADGSLALAGGRQESVGLWKVGQRRRVHSFPGHIFGAAAVSLSADGCWAATAGRVKVGHSFSMRKSVQDRWSDKELLHAVRLWNTKTGRCVHTLMGQTDSIRTVSLNADGRWLLTGGDDTVLRLWDTATGQCVHRLRGHTKAVRAVSLSADGLLALSGGDDKTVRVWDLARGRCLRTLTSHKGAVTSVSLSADGQVGLSCGLGTLRKGTVILWRIEPTSFLCSLYPSPILSYVESRQRETQVTQLLSQARQARENWHIPLASSLMQELRALAGYERQPEYEKEWTMLARYCQHSALLEARPLKTLQGHSYSVDAVDLSVDGNRAISGSKIDGSAYVWNVETGRSLFSVSSSAVCYSVSLNADGSRALSVGFGKMGIWNVETGHLLRLFEQEAGSACLSMDGRWFVSTDPSSIVSVWKVAAARVWDVDTGSCVALLQTQGKRGRNYKAEVVKLSRNGRWAITGGLDGARVWDITQGSCVAVLDKSTGEVKSVDVSADGRWAITGGDDNMVQVWDVAQERCVNVLPVRDNLTNPVSLSADGRWAITGGDGNTVRVWDVVQARCVSILYGHTDHISSVALSADGQRVISASWDKTVRVWELDWELEAHEMADWDEGARSYLEAFLILHTPYAPVLPVLQERLPIEDGAVRAVTRRGVPTWTEKDFQGLISLLQCAGYGWLQAEGVHKQLEQMTNSR